MANYCKNCGVRIANGMRLCKDCRTSPWFLSDDDDDYPEQFDDEKKKGIVKRTIKKIRSLG